MPEPQIITAGETLLWNRSVPEYPASDGWTLKYALQRAADSPILITATADGAAHVVSVAAATSAAYPAGAYIWTAFVEKAAERYTVSRGVMTILASPLTAPTASHAARTLALIESAIQGRIPNGLESTSVDGQELRFIPIDKLVDLRDRYRREVMAEQFAASSALGIRKRRSIGIRFVRPS